MKYQVTLEDAIARLGKPRQEIFTNLMKNGTMQVQYYAPKKSEACQAKERDEIFVIASGFTTFYRNGERMPCKAGDVLFVAAGIERRFENFTEDFAAWVVQYEDVPAKSSGKSHEFFF
jgi:mannose-6-phosphate isomerase-like protein (cupin superfamily)